MIHKLASDKQSFEIHYTSCTLEGQVFRDRIEQLAGANAHFYTSRETQGKRINLEQLLSTPGSEVHIYICGPRRMIATVREIAKIQGWPASKIHFESFVAQPLADDQPIRVHLTKSNKTIDAPDNQTILDTLLNASVDVPNDCKRGECSICRTQVEGEPDHRDLCLSTIENTFVVVRLCFACGGRRVDIEFVMEN